MTTHPGHHTLLNTHYSMHYLLRVMYADFSKPAKIIHTYIKESHVVFALSSLGYSGSRIMCTAQA